MRVFAITPQGLGAIGVSVLALWACWGFERRAERQAGRDLLASQIVLMRLRERAVPVSEPEERPFRSERPATS